MTNNGIPELKMILLGESGVGKTSIINQFTSGIFDEDTGSSLSAQFVSKEIEIEKLCEKIKFDIWDTAGQEQYRAIAKIFYKNAKIIILCYDITNRHSFNELKEYWYEQQTKLYVDSNPVMAVVANKSDLYNESEAINEEEGIAFAKEIGAIFQMTSAKSNSGIDQLFQNIGQKYVNRSIDFNKIEDEEKQEYDQKKTEILEQKKDAIPGNRGIKLKKKGAKKKDKDNQSNNKKSIC